jgi:hypothetical protein
VAYERVKPTLFLDTSNLSSSLNARIFYPHEAAGKVTVLNIIFKVLDKGLND